MESENRMKVQLAQLYNRVKEMKVKDFFKSVAETFVLVWKADESNFNTLYFNDETQNL